MRNIILSIPESKVNNVALITGGSRGIGLGIAKHLAKSGFDLAINGVRPGEQARDILDELRDLGADVIYCQGDVSDPVHRTSIVSTVREHFGRLHLLVNNAGIAPRQRADILEITEASFEEVLRVNLQGPFFLTQSVANWMIAQKEAEPSYMACIINITSISARVASVNRGEYCISKAGLSMMTKLFAVSLGDYDIPVCEIQPGIIKTDMTAPVEDKYNKRIDEGLSLQKRWGTPDDVGRAVTAVASGNFPFSTGHIFVVDGGLTVNRL
ncbi:MAG: 3-ketoacyl-ACP reductase [Calditrichaeota bacterium]|nr:MAG: 3-ketoacyl-ACP reductase [Calditrichota bacterium]